MVSISSIGRSFANRFDVESMRDLADREKLDAQNQGYRSGEVSILGVAQLALDAAENAIFNSNLEKHSIECIIFSTESLWEDRLPFMERQNYSQHLKLREEVIHTLMGEGGFADAILFGNTFGACANGGNALCVATSLLKAKLFKNVMLINADRLNKINPRVKNGRLASDIATAVILDSSPGIAEVGNQWLISCSELSAIRNVKSKDQNATAFLKAIRSLRKKLDEVDEFNITSYDGVVFENLKKSAIDICSRTLRVAHERVLTPTRYEYGHAFSSDIFLSLQSIIHMPSNKNRSLLLISLGTTSAALQEINIRS